MDDVNNNNIFKVRKLFHGIRGYISVLSNVLDCHNTRNATVNILQYQSINFFYKLLNMKAKEYIYFVLQHRYNVCVLGGERELGTSFL